VCSHLRNRPARNDEHLPAVPRRDAPELCVISSAWKQRAWWMPGACRTRSLACKMKQGTRASSPR